MLNSLRMKKVRWYLFPLHSCESVWITQIERRSTHHAGSFWCERHDNTCICKLRSFTECSLCCFSSMLDNSCYVIAAVFEGDAPTGTAATAGDNGYRLQIWLCQWHFAVLLFVLLFQTPQIELEYDGPGEELVRWHTGTGFLLVLRSAVSTNLLHFTLRARPPCLYYNRWTLLKG